VSAAGEANGSALAGEALSRARVHCRTAGGSLYDTPSWEGATSSIQCGSVWNEAVRNFAEAYG